VENGEEAGELAHPPSMRRAGRARQPPSAGW